ncbi:PIN domain-containing protein [Pricia sp. S334]|uniref:PIN domain-containing protein n=1 Tax=Pricia mediterranea TaxID=3076079 RepID=A0ABU3L3C0_9FLAO|nr:PIN domain-containing protein [Pricia sp. S334]MDT7827694.1 PIN domain-containing protein [Pricia sp. S334]
MEKVLLDTDVLLDFFFDRKPFSDHTAQVLDLCEKKKIEGFTTPVIIANAYYLLRRDSRHEKVINKLLQLLNIIDIVKMDRKVVIKALNSDFKDFEDALQNFSAVEMEKIKTILTRNIKDFKKSELAVMTPETYLKGRKASG